MGELFDLRLFLHHPSSMGSTPFNDVKNINGLPCETFRGACMKLGILDDDTEWERAIERAVLSCMPCHIRQLLVTLLTSCDIGSPRQLFDRFKIKMMEDYTHKLQLANIKYVSDHVTEAWLLNDLEKRLQSLGKELRDVNIHSRDVTSRF
jgi:hypothetical protein